MLFTTRRLTVFFSKSYLCLVFFTMGREEIKIIIRVYVISIVDFIHT